MALQNPTNFKNSSTSIRSQYRKDLTVLQEINPDKLAMRIKRKSNNRLAVPGFDSFAKEFRGN